MSVRVIARGETQLTLDRRALDVAPATLAAIDARWSEAHAARPNLFDGTLLAFSGDTLAARVVPYRYYVAQRADEGVRGALDLRPLGVSGLVVTTDGCILLGKRSANVTQYPSCWEAVPSGSVDERAIAGTALDPEIVLVRELAEEAGLGEGEIARIEPLALLLDEAEHTYDVAYVVKVTLTSTALAVKLRGDAEYVELRVVAPADVAAALDTPDVVPTTRVVWDLYRRGETA